MASDRPADLPRARFIINPAAIIVVCAIGLTILGLTILFSASASLTNKLGVNVPYLYVQKQLAGVVAAAVLCFVVSRLDLDFLRNYVWWAAGVTLLLLLLVLVPHVGIAVKGSKRWIGYGGARLQVSEFAKLAMVFCLAHYLLSERSAVSSFSSRISAPPRWWARSASCCCSSRARSGATSCRRSRSAFPVSRCS
jgi:cell division protein FtsW